MKHTATATGGMCRIQGAVQDITDVRANVEHTRELAQRLDMTLESLTDAFFTVDRSWRFTYVNPEAERVLQRPRQQLLGRAVWDEFPQAAESRFRREYVRALASGEAVEFEEHYAPLDLWVMVNAYRSQQGLAVFFRDVTVQRHVADALKNSEEQYRTLFENSLDNPRHDARRRHSGRQRGRVRTVWHGREELCAAPRGAHVVHDQRLQTLLEERRRTGRAKGELTMVHADGSHIEVEVQ